MKKCPHPLCFAPDVTCALGNQSPSDCPEWKREQVSTQGTADGNSDLLFPWSGQAMGLIDAAFVSGRAKPSVVAIVGPHNAGKTTLLAAWYLLLGRGLRAKTDHSFSGCYSLTGWETIATWLRWNPGAPPSFPPHTASSIERAPGLLHLAFTCDSDSRKDYLFSDAPGEWFHKWALNRESDDAAGARWLAQHADVFLLVADREALSGETKGTARGALLLLIQRLASELKGRPIALVWTKEDVAVDKAMENAVRDSVLRHMPDAVEFSTTVLDSSDHDAGVGQGFLELLGWILDRKRAPGALPQLSGETCDPLLVHGSR
jgi:hypothetical protein